MTREETPFIPCLVYRGISHNSGESQNKVATTVPQNWLTRIGLDKKVCLIGLESDSRLWIGPLINMDVGDTYCGFTWATLGIDIRGSVKGKDYNANATLGDSWVFCVNLFHATNTTQGEVQFSKQDQILLKCRELHYGGGTGNLYHYSVAMLDSEDIPLDEWIEIDVDLRRCMQDFQHGFVPFWTAEKTYLIQPFVETCGGSIEAYFDYVKLS
jgi:hypothetical protein